MLSESEQQAIAAKSQIVELEAKLAVERDRIAEQVEETHRQQCKFEHQLEEERGHATLLRSKLDDLTRHGGRPSLLSQFFGSGCASSGDAESRAMRNGVRADVLQNEVRRLTMEVGKRAMLQEGAEQDAKARDAEAERAVQALAN